MDNHPLIKATIPTSYSLLVAAELGLNERSLEKLILNCGLDVDDLLSDRSLLTADQQIQIIRNALILSNDDTIGLRLGNRLTPPTHGPLGFLANSCPNLREAIAAFETFLPARMSFINISSQSVGHWYECQLNVELDADETVIRFALEALSLSLLSLIEYILGRPLIGGEISFNYSTPHYIERYSEYFPCPVTFFASKSLLRIPLELLETANATAHHQSYTLALDQCQQMLNQLPSAQRSTQHLVKSFMLTHPSEQVSEDRVAAALFITKRTLARRLSAEDTSYRKIREEILSSLASRYLEDSTLSVEAIALLLGYHDSANFRRAFKRWFSMTPSDYRAQRLARHST